jgi:peptidoglycan/LPS O-acetylase OafA/YrhL
MRHDIQFLRGIAVLSVLLYHAQFGLISNGYLGVDVFFVISGFLITKIILRGLDEETFSFGKFYLRRAKRLLPALYSTLTFTTLLAYIFLTQSQGVDYLYQFIGAITFTSNLVLPFQVGYFENAAESKPLLHIWSLSVEEQYYFFLPLLLFIFPAKLRGYVLSISALLSLALCLYFLEWAYTYWRFPDTNTTELAFYLFPTRAWELLCGSLLAWFMLKNPNFSISKYIKLAALAGLLMSMCFSLDDTHPRGNAIIVVLLTCTLILGRDNWLPKQLITQTIERVGDWSYSLYLIHWPLLAFAQISFLGEVPLIATIVLASISVPLAYFQYQLVEQKFRYGFRESSKLTSRVFVIASLAMFALPLPGAVLYLSNNNTTQDFSHLRRANYGIDEACDRPYRATNMAVCQTAEKPIIAVWGDSYAMHLIPGLLNNRVIADSLIQMTMSFCGPILDLAPVTNKYNQRWAKKCIAHNQHVIETIRTSKSIKYVVMSSPFHQYLKDLGQSLLYNKAVIPQSNRLAVSQLTNTIREVQKAGKIPVIVSPPPKSGFNIGDCLERSTNNIIIFGREDCSINVEEYRRYEKNIISALKEVQRNTGVHILWLDSLLCDGYSCKTSMGHTYVYRDRGHLSYDGSVALLSGLDIKSLFGSSSG